MLKYQVPYFSARFFPEDPVETMTNIKTSPEHKLRKRFGFFQKKKQYLREIIHNLHKILCSSLCVR